MNHTAPADAKYLDVVATARLVRAAVKAAWPDARFAVRGQRYAGGSSITVHWTDGPPVHEVEALIDVYRGGDFDGQTDAMTYREPTLLAERGDNLPEYVRFGVHFISTNRALSDDYRTFLEAAAVTLSPAETRGWVDVTTPFGVFGNDRHLLPYYLSEHLSPVVAARLAALPIDQRTASVEAL